jgi:hypothetical protein
MATPGEALQTSPAYILKQFIIAEGIGSMTNPSAGNDWPLYISSTPDGSGIKTNLGVLYDSVPLKDGRLMDGPVIVHYGIQLRIRSQKHLDGYTKAEEIAAALDGIANGTITINAKDYIIVNVSRSGPPISLGAEKGTTNRRLFTVNFSVTMKRVV